MTGGDPAQMMSRLTHVIVFTPDVEGLRRFYQDRLGLGLAREGHGWVALRPAGAALWLHALGSRHKPEVAIALHVGDLDAAITALRAHGADVTERENDAIFGRAAYVRDPEGNLVDLHAGVSAERPGAEPAFPTVVLNVRNMAAARAFYRDVLGLPARIDSPEWADFETGATRLALHPRAGQPGREGHHESPITIGFTGPRDAVSFARVLEKRGLRLAGPPRNDGFGTFAEAADPDGNAIVLRGTVEPPAEKPVAAKPRARAKRKPAAKKQPARAARGKAAAKQKRSAAKRRTASRKLKR
jgi:catechol 2,3-dioxygenase-like lactoylglutathione lyase family enzyme